MSDRARLRATGAMRAATPPGVRGRFAPWLVAFACCLGVRGALAADPVTAVEYYNAALDHYFVSPLAADIAALDSGRIRGWARSGETFLVFASAADAPAGAQPVCRFYIPPEHGDSHFLSASAEECAAVAARIGTDPNFSGYVLETSAAFYVVLPDRVTGACAGGLAPVYRLWNARPDSNHRYTTSSAIRAQMIRRAYRPEGYGPDGVAMCVPASPSPALVHATGLSPLRFGCDGEPATGALFLDSEVEPRVDVDPNDPQHLLGVWQQDRWSDGGARGLLAGVSRDGGRTWTRSAAAFSRCTGGASAGADYARASDPWTSFAPDGTVYQIAIAFNGATFAPGSSSAVLVSRSTDGGVTWDAPTALIRDGDDAFDDKESITADPHDSRFAYAVWDRTIPDGSGPTWFSRTTDGGLTWEAARPIYDPGRRSQTLNNQIVVLPDGTLLDFFTEFRNVLSMTFTTLSVVRSSDHGETWSTPEPITSSLPVGARDPETGALVRDGANLASVAIGRNGKIAIVWQDARTSPGATIEGILYTQSSDGGGTWSAPARINAVARVHAFLPTVNIRDDGTIGVTYYDFRNNTPDPGTLLTDVWLTESIDGVTWRETHVAGPFDLALAPNARGLFLGDYQGLASTPTRFVPFFATTNGDPGNRSDILTDLALGTAARKAAPAEPALRLEAEPAPLTLTPELRRAASRTATRTLAARWRGPLPPPPTRTP